MNLEEARNLRHALDEAIAKAEAEGSDEVGALAGVESLLDVLEQVTDKAVSELEGAVEASRLAGTP